MESSPDISTFEGLANYFGFRPQDSNISELGMAVTYAMLPNRRYDEVIKDAFEFYCNEVIERSRGNIKVKIGVALYKAGLVKAGRDIQTFEAEVLKAVALAKQAGLEHEVAVIKHSIARLMSSGQSEEIPAFLEEHE